MSIIKDLLLKLKQERPLAAEFLAIAGQYGDALDNVVDISNEPSRVKALCEKNAEMYNCAYWKRWGHLLLFVITLARNQYFDSVKWEGAEEEWKRQHAKVYSHAGILIILSVIMIEYGNQAVDNVSLSLREEAYTLHKEDKI